MSGSALTPTFVLSLEATLRYGEATFQLKERSLRKLIVDELNAHCDQNLTGFIDRIEIDRHGNIHVFEQFCKDGKGVAVPSLYPPVKKILELHLFKKGEALFTSQMTKIKEGFVPKLIEFNQKYVTPFASGWGSVRNLVGISFAIIKILAIAGLITLNPHAFATMILVYGCFVLVQGLLSVGPILAGTAADGAQLSRVATALGDKKHQRTATLKKWAALGALAEGTFWIAIAICDFSGMLTLGSLLTKILFWGIFNATFSYAALCATRDYLRHRKFKQRLKEVMNEPTLKTDRERYLAGLKHVRDKWRIHLKPDHTRLNADQLVQKAGRKIFRLDEQTYDEAHETLKQEVDCLISRLEESKEGVEKDA